MVAHVLGSAQMGDIPAKPSHHTAATTSSHSPCGATRNLLLYNDRLVELATGENQVLVSFKVNI